MFSAPLWVYLLNDLTGSPRIRLGSINGSKCTENKRAAFSWQAFASILRDCPNLRSLGFQMVPPLTRPLFTLVDTENSVEGHLREFLDTVLIRMANVHTIKDLRIDIFDSKKTLQSIGLLENARKIISMCQVVQLEGQTNFWESLLDPSLPSRPFPQIRKFVLSDSRVKVSHLIVFLKNTLPPAARILLRRVYIGKTAICYSAEGDVVGISERLRTLQTASGNGLEYQ